MTERAEKNTHVAHSLSRDPSTVLACPTEAPGSIQRHGLAHRAAPCRLDFRATPANAAGADFQDRRVIAERTIRAASG
jgi:hypothetical protein